MVEDRITDGRRIAQLLASELTGLATGPLADVAVADADPDAVPSPEGTRTYEVTDAEEQVAAVWITPDTARVTFAEDLDRASIEVPENAPDLSIEENGPGDGPTLRVESGAAVKWAVDALEATLD